MPILHLQLSGSSQTTGHSGSIEIKNNVPKQPIYLKGYSFSTASGTTENRISDNGCFNIELSFLNNVDINGNLTPTCLSLPSVVESNHQILQLGLNWGFLPSKDIYKNITYKIVDEDGNPLSTWVTNTGAWRLHLYFQYNRNLVF